MVTGNQNGVTEVKGTTRLEEDGRMLTRSYYLQNGQWVEGHAVTYRETQGEEVIFR
jgi:hypothetical protein